MKNKILIISAVLAVGCLVMVIVSGRAVDSTRKELNQERFNRIDAEEKLEKALAKIKTLESDAANVQKQTQNAQALLDQEKKANQELKDELEKMTKLKGILEDQLKNALVNPVSPPVNR